MKTNLPRTVGSGAVLLVGTTCRSSRPRSSAALPLKTYPCLIVRLLAFALLAAALVPAARAQTLLNVDFGVGPGSGKSGFAGTGLATNDFWNHYNLYGARFIPGTPLRPDGRLENLKLWDGADSTVALAVTNAPGVWGNASGDKMFDSYLFAMNGSNLTATITGLLPGRYHFYLYGHADPDATGEQNSHFTIRSGTNTFGPLTTSGATGWKAHLPWEENRQFVVFRDVPVFGNQPVVIEAAPGPNGVAVINGLQILSRGTAPPKAHAPVVQAQSAAFTNLIVREVRYTGQLGDHEARFQAALTVESLHTNEIKGVLFEGDVAVLAPKLPDGLRLTTDGRQVRLFVARAGVHELKLELLARITREEPWNRVTFTGPPAAIATVHAQAGGKDVEVQLLSGVSEAPTARPTVSTGMVQGFLSADRQLALRWQSRAIEVARKSLITVDTAVAAKITPTVIQYGTRLRYEILQAPAAQLYLAIPQGQTLTRIDGAHIRDWHLINPAAAGHPIQLQPEVPPGALLLKVEFLKPVDKAYQLTLYTEQPVESASLSLAAPQPLEVSRESGSFQLSADEMTVEVASVNGLRQVNASEGTLAAYRFFGRPASLTAGAKRIEPVITAADRVGARLEESRLLVTHTLSLQVEKAGIYAVELTPQSGFTVSDVRGEGVDDWKLADGKLRVSFNSRVLGARALTVQLEQPLRDVPPQFTIAPLRVAGAVRETAQVGAASVAGIRLKTFDPDGLREVPITSLPNRSDEVLAYTDLRADWNLTLAAERLEARIVAEVFNLVTIGDGLVGGSAVVRYGLINQGVQDFKVALPAHWKNVEFTGANIRRKEPAPAAAQGDTNSVLWNIALQDKAWGGYTLVVTYDYQFDPKGAALDLRGAHPPGVERETGSLAVTTAAGLKLEPRAAESPLRVIDPVELADTDRSLVTRPILLAYRYTGTNFTHGIGVTRHAEVTVLDAVADRTQLTTVLTEDGQMLTQASFMVKNNDRQYQRFELPPGASLWAAHVNGEPVKAEKDGPWTLVSLPRTANRDQAFAVDLIYQGNLGTLDSLWPKKVALAAPKTDVPNTYAEWQVYVPASRRLMNFGGSMTVARGTEYGLREAWTEFTAFYHQLWRNTGLGAVVFVAVLLAIVALIANARHRGATGIMQVMAVIVVIGLMAAMAIPNFVRARTTAQKNSTIANFRQLDGALQQYLLENKTSVLPSSADALKPYLKNNQLPTDPMTGGGYHFAAAGLDVSQLKNKVVFFTDAVNGHRGVMTWDGIEDIVNEQRFSELLQGQNVVPQTAAASPTQPQADAARRKLAGTALAAITAPTAQNPLANVGGMAAPTVAGLRSIRIELPKTGLQFNFTKVLGTGAEPLRVEMSMMEKKAFQTARMVLQLAAFLAGLFLIWREWHRAHASALRLALGVMLALGAVGSLFIAGRVLHWLFIAAVPVVALLFFIWLARRLWQHSAKAAPAEALASGGLPPAALALIGLLGLQLSTSPSQAAAPSANSTIRIPHPTITNAVLVLPANYAGPVPGIVGQAAAPSAYSSITNLVSVLSAAYTGSVTGQVAQFEAAIQLSNLGTNQSLALFSDDVALTHFAVQGGEARLVREGKGVSVLLPQPGEFTLQVKLAARLTGDVTRRQLAFAIPPALASRLNVVIDEEDAGVEFPSAVSLRRTASGAQTHVEAVAGPAGRVDLQWTPRVKRAAETAVTAFAENATLMAFGGGVVTLQTQLKYQITQGELQDLSVRLPAGQRLLKVEGEGISTWHIAEEASPTDAGSKEEVLKVRLLKPVKDTWQLTVITERTLDELPAQVAAATAHALGVQRETGHLAVQAGDDLTVSVESVAGLERVDAREFARVFSGKPEAVPAGLVSAFRFWRQDYALTARAAIVQPQIEVVAHNHLRVGYEQLNLNAQLDFHVKQAGVFGVRLVLPPNFRVESVTASGGVAQTRGGQKATGGAAIQMWNERRENNARVLAVDFKERTLGQFQVNVALEQITMQLPPAINVAGVHPLGVHKLSGFVAVTSETGVGVKSGAFSGLIEIPASTLPRRVSAAGGGVLAFKFTAAEGAAEQPWSLAVGNEGMESWVRAEVVHLVTVSETLASGRALVRYDIQNAPVKEFRLRVPANYRNVEITGANIRRRDQDGDEWKVELQNKVRGEVQLTVTWEEPKDARTNTVNVAGIEALGAERETGAVVIYAKAPLQVTGKETRGDVSRIDAREVPAWAGVGTGETAALSYRYLRPGWQVALEARRHEDAALLQALVESAKLTTVVADDGQMMTEMTLQVRNNGRQFVEITLPDKAELWSAFIAGQPVRPTRQGDVLLLPLEQAGGTDTAVMVELIFVHADKFPKTKGGVSLASPKLGVPLKNARWELWLPPDHEYAEFTGSMTHESGSAPVSLSYSAVEYTLKESARVSSRQSETVIAVSNLKNQLQAGNFREANEFLRQAKDNRDLNPEALNNEVAELEQQLKRGQGGKLIEAQVNYAMENSARFGAQMPAQQRMEAGQQAQAVQVGGYDEDIAQRQWDMLCKAQELDTARNHALRLNLPTRGLRHSFSQVLQTEINKPMTIAFTAHNTKRTGWPQTLALSTGGFAVLWVLSATALARRREEKQ